MSNYCRIAEVLTSNETIRIIKAESSVIVSEGDLVRHYHSQEESTDESA